MIAHLVDSIGNHPKLHNHVCYNEQGAAFAAVGEAKISGHATFAYSTSGPGAMNLINGIADAYFDSCPVIFITGQLNTNEYLSIPNIRQHGFQQMDVVSVMKPITKYCTMVDDPEDIPLILEEAWYEATSGRPGPVVIDLPMNMQRQNIDPSNVEHFKVPTKNFISTPSSPDNVAKKIMNALSNAERPVLLLGNGATKNKRDLSRKVVEKLGIPTVTSLLGRDILPFSHPLNFGFIGSAYGHRYANLIIHKKADLIICLGDSLCKRQTGMNTENFASQADIIRVDIDPVELSRRVHKSETSYLADCRDVMLTLLQQDQPPVKYSEWLRNCQEIKDELIKFDNTCEERIPNRYIELISDMTTWAGSIAADVGQHQMWTAQSYKLREDQRMIFSGGHGCMGFSLPASFGAYYATSKPVITIVGDGSLQMNIQELEWLNREQLPITVFVMNNHALGLIHQQQNSLFEGRYFSSAEIGGYSVPDFPAIASAYGINSYSVNGIKELSNVLDNLNHDVPNLINIELSCDTSAAPKTSFGEEMHMQKPYIPKKLMDKLLAL